MRIRALAVITVLALAGCGNKPRVPDWQLNARDSLERYQQAYLVGDERVALAEFERARRELGATGRPGLVARAELTRCALQVASLVFEACAGFEALRTDAPVAERAYADYLQARIASADTALLPPQHQAVAGGSADAATLVAVADPLSRLVAAGVLLRAGRANPELLDLAQETASAQGWRRPLLAWLGVAAERAQRAGAADEAARLRRRMALVAGEK